MLPIRFPVPVFFRKKIRKFLRRKIVKKKFIRAEIPLGQFLIVIKGKKMKVIPSNFI